jgi:hypothetical protein
MEAIAEVRHSIAETAACAAMLAREAAENAPTAEGDVQLQPSAAGMLEPLAESLAAATRGAFLPVDGRASAAAADMRVGEDTRAAAGMAAVDTAN